MHFYRCLYYTSPGKTETSVLAANDESELVRSFAGSGKTLVSIDVVDSREAYRSKAKKTRNSVLQFTEMMDLLIESGLSLKEALDISSTIRGKNGISELSGKLREQVRKGISISRAIESMPEVFPPIYRGMIRVGDRIGSVERIFPQLASYLRDRKKLRDKVASAMAYPLFVLVVAVLGAIGMSLFVIPKMESIFSGFGGAASDNIRSNITGMKILFSILGSIVGVLAASIPVLHLAGKHSIPFRLKLERFLLRLPVAGKFIASWETLNFAFAMETLSAGGVPVEIALEEAALVVANSAYRDALLAVREDLLKGISLTQAFSSHAEFPDYFRQWVAIGERSGKTERVFAQIRSYYQGEVDRQSSRLMILIEPALIVLIGIFLLAIVIGIVVPLFSMYGTLL